MPRRAARRPEDPSPAAGSQRPVTPPQRLGGQGPTLSHQRPNGGGEAATREGVSQVKPALDVFDVETEFLDLLQPAGQEPINLELGTKPRHRQVVGAQREVRPGASRGAPLPKR